MSENILEPIIKEIWESVKAEANRIISEAKKEAEKIISDAKNKAKKIKAEKEIEYRKKLRKKLMSKIALRRLEIKREYLKQRANIIRSIFNEALKRVRKEIENKTENYKLGVRRLVEEAVKQISSKNIIIACNSRDRELVSEVIAEIARKYNKEVKLARENIDCMGGIIAYSSDLREYFNNTIDARIERAENELLPKLLEKYIRVR